LYYGFIYAFWVASDPKHVAIGSLVDSIPALVIAIVLTNAFYGLRKY